MIDALLGRSKPPRNNLDALFALPTAAVTLQTAAGFEPTGVGAVCFRQAEGSGIILNAHRVNAGEVPQLRDLEDFYFFPKPRPEACAELVVDLVCNRIPRRFNVDARRAIQVLSPTHRGPAGVQALNKLLQAAQIAPRNNGAN